jgi:multiple sugar transport system ATP-binding protein
MNLLPGTIEGGTVRLADGTGVPVPDRLKDCVRNGMAVQLGIRPDDISPIGHGLSQDGPGAEVQLTVDLAEPLGMESLIYTRLAGQEVQAKLYGPRIVAPGEVLTFRLALDRAHLFDAATGKSVRVA